MGLFKKLTNIAKDAAMDALKDKPGLSNLAASVGNMQKNDESSADEDMSATRRYAENNYKEEDYDDEDFDDEDYDDEDYDDEDYDDEDYDDEDYDDEDYDDEDYDDESDEDLYELGEEIDRALANGNLDREERDMLQMRAAALNIDIDEFDALLQARIEQLEAAVEAGYSREEVYRTRSVWRRCPNCYHLVSAQDMFCPYCNYQLRHRVATMVMGGLLYAGAQTRRRRSDGTARPVRRKAAKPGERRAKGTKPGAARRKTAPGATARPRPERRTAAPASKSSLMARSESKKSRSSGSESILSKKSPAKSVSKPKKSGGLFGSSKPKKSGGLLGGIKKKRR